MFEETWTDISPAREAGIKQHLPAIRLEIEAALNSGSWTKKIQGANAIKTICKDVSSGLGEQREQFVRALLAAAHGKTFDGKHHIVEALADLCEVKEGEAGLSPALADECVAALLAEARKPEPAYKRRALAALSRALPATTCDRFQQVYDIVKQILSKDESSVGKESDEEDNEGARQRREQLTALKEAAYDLLGKAWPQDPHTQEKYQGVFFEHCATCYAGSSRAAQLAVLAALRAVLPALACLGAARAPIRPRDTRDAPADAVAAIVGHVTAIVEYTLSKAVCPPTTVIPTVCQIVIV
ncbi:hypothetical protein ACJJTC_003778 [Scirpophaga incertulas]